MLVAALAMLAQTAHAAAPANPPSLDAVFNPNASVCVKFDARGFPTAALVNGSKKDPQLNRAMLDLLRKRQWDVPPKKWIGRWIALSVAPNGYPVPEILPTCPKH